MGFGGSWLIFVELGGYRCDGYWWFSMDLGGSWWLSVDIGVSRWLSVDLGGYRWIFVVLVGYQWFSVVNGGSQWRGEEGWGEGFAIFLSDVHLCATLLHHPRKFWKTQ